MTALAFPIALAVFCGLAFLHGYHAAMARIFGVPLDLACALVTGVLFVQLRLQRVPLESPIWAMALGAFTAGLAYYLISIFNDWGSKARVRALLRAVDVHDGLQPAPDLRSVGDLVRVSPEELARILATATDPVGCLCEACRSMRLCAGAEIAFRRAKAERDAGFATLNPNEARTPEELAAQFREDEIARQVRAERYGGR